MGCEAGKASLGYGVPREMSCDPELVLGTWREGSTRGVRRSLRSFAREAGLSTAVTPHMLRHTCATLLLENGVGLRFRQRLLGHENIATTAIYAHVGDVGLKRALEEARLLVTLTLGRPAVPSRRRERS
jgi:integrase